MTEATTADRVRKVLGEQAGKPAAEITDTLSLRNDLRFDSLAYVETIVLLEQEFDIHIADADFEPSTVGDVVKFMEKKYGRDQ